MKEKRECILEDNHEKENKCSSLNVTKVVVVSNNYPVAVCNIG
ncbi:MAG: hypothetical protein PV340_00570 [Wolbachia sp.]|nr:hypothetical protein [Wolbachia sp.]MDD9336826.1 hypothetical protein [Wolbachia sp.]